MSGNTIGPNSQINSKVPDFLRQTFYHLTEILLFDANAPLYEEPIEISYQLYRKARKMILPYTNSEPGLDTCPICMLEFEPLDEILKIGCDHHFHQACILTWFLNSDNCPICRQPHEGTLTATTSCLLDSSDERTWKLPMSYFPTVRYIMGDFNQKAVIYIEEIELTKYLKLEMNIGTMEKNKMRPSS